MKEIWSVYRRTRNQNQSAAQAKQPGESGGLGAKMLFSTKHIRAQTTTTKQINIYLIVTHIYTRHRNVHTHTDTFRVQQFVWNIKRWRGRSWAWKPKRMRLYSQYNNIHKNNPIFMFSNAHANTVIGYWGFSSLWSWETNRCLGKRGDDYCMATISERRIVFFPFEV